MNLQNDACLKIVPLVSTEQEKIQIHREENPTKPTNQQNHIRIAFIMHASKLAI